MSGDTRICVLVCGATVGQRCPSQTESNAAMRLLQTYVHVSSWVVV